jgi:hypothetical protein
MHVSLPENCGGSRIQTWNRYAYVANNPLRYLDPLGLDNDCGGPCTPFSFSDGNCTTYVSYHSETSSTGGSYDIPDFTSFCHGSGSVRNPGPLWTVADWDDVHGTGPCHGKSVDCFWKNGATGNSPATKNGITTVVSAAPPQFQYKPNCTWPAIGDAVSAAGHDFFPPPSSNPVSDIFDKLQDKNVQRATVGTLYVIANYARPIAPILDFATDWIPVVGQAMFAYQGFSALRAGWDAYKGSIDQCYDKP